MHHLIKYLALVVVLLPMATPAFCDKATDYNKDGGAKIAKGDFDGAIADYTQAIALKPDYANAYSNRGFAKYGKGDFGGAIADYSKAIELKPDYSDFHYSRGLAKNAQDDFEGAIVDYTKAIALDPANLPAYSSRGFAKLDRGDFDGAIADFTMLTTLIRSKPDLAGIYSNRGLAKHAKGDLDGALADFTKAIKLKSDLAGIYYNRGRLRYDSRAFKEALIDFRKAVDLDRSNDNDRPWVWLARARLGEAEAATSELQKYLAGRTAGKPDDWSSKIGRFLTGQLTEAEFLVAANNPDPKTEAKQLCKAYFYAGSKRLIAGDKAAAMDYFQKSIATDYKGYQECVSAAAELKLLKAQKQ